MANGATYDQNKISFAHRTWRFGTEAEICYRGRCVVAKCTDRGPYIVGRDIDLSLGLADALHFTGVHPVRVTVVSVPSRPESHSQRKAQSKVLASDVPSSPIIVPQYPYLRHAEEE